jgi:hypothetical protein
MNALVGAFGARIAGAPPPDRTVIDRDVSELAQLSAKAREHLTTFRRMNEMAKLAAAACRDRGKNPLSYADDAVGRVGRMKSEADAIVRGIADASALVTPCSGADGAIRARELHAQATRSLAGLEQTGRDARADIVDALKFFAALKTARDQAPYAARLLAVMQATVRHAREIEGRLSDAIAVYAGELAGFDAASAGHHVRRTSFRAWAGSTI